MSTHRSTPAFSAGDFETHPVGTFQRIAELERQVESLLTTLRRIKHATAPRHVFDGAYHGEAYELAQTALRSAGGEG